ncbi:hypothetical protein Trydic_g11156 [Trypoxylus dichotomus]
MEMQKGLSIIIEDGPYSGRPSTSPVGTHVQKIKDLENLNRNLTARELVEELDMCQVAFIMRIRQTFHNGCAKKIAEELGTVARQHMIPLSKQWDHVLRFVNSTVLCKKSDDDSSLALLLPTIFPKLQSVLKELCFETIDDIEK